METHKNGQKTQYQYYRRSCQILGIISIIYAAGVESKFYRGDIVGAENASRTAKTLVIASVAFGIITIIAVGIIAALGMFAGYYNN